VKEPSELIITGQKGYASTNPVLNLIFLGRDFKEDEAELCLTHETLHIVVFELEGMMAYNLFDRIVIFYSMEFGENIEGFNKSECF
jgi:hypothetical protein